MTRAADFLNKSVDELGNFDWHDLSDPDSIGSWPAAVKYVFCAVVFMVCLVAGYWFHIRSMREELLRTAGQENELRTQLESRAELAGNLEAYREQMHEIEASFDALLGQLPADTEVAGLLEDITSAGLSSGLEFSSIHLQDKVEREFYIELSIDIEVAGDYHDFGSFISAVASLPRIVTLHDFNISKAENVRGELNMSVTARTYRYKPRDE